MYIYNISVSNNGMVEYDCNVSSVCCSFSPNNAFNGKKVVRFAELQKKTHSQNANGRWFVAFAKNSFPYIYSRHTGGAKEIRTHIIIIFFTSRAHYDRAFLL